MPPANPTSVPFRPRVFVGSSGDGIKVARIIKESLKRFADVKLWEKDVFRPGEITIEVLLREAAAADFAVLVATPDRSRSPASTEPSANIIFEMGVFMSRLGTQRTFIIFNRCNPPSLPTDVDGITSIAYDAIVTKRRISLADSIVVIEKAIQAHGLCLEVDFLRSYLARIPPNIKVGDAYGCIIEAHWDEIKRDLEQLTKAKSWAKLVQVKERLREYLEYAGKYDEGVKFGHDFVDALSGMGRYLEADWARIKDVGYMNILSRHFDAGRTAIKAVIAMREPDMTADDDMEVAKLMFYAYRYYGISFHRERGIGQNEQIQNLEKAEIYFRKARTCAEIARQIDEEQAQELIARILGNEGNLAETRGHYHLAYDLHQQSLRLFESQENKDREHIGSAHWHLAEALLMNREERDLSKVSKHLDIAYEHFLHLGWREGMAKVHRYRSKYFQRVAETDPAERQKCLKEARDAAHNALVLYREMPKPEEVEKMETLIAELTAT